MWFQIPPPQPGKLGRLQSSPGLPHSSVSQCLSLQGSILDLQKHDLPSAHDRDMWEVGSGLGSFYGSGRLSLQQGRWCGSGHRTSKSHSSPRCGCGETQTVTQVPCTSGRPSPFYVLPRVFRLYVIINTMHCHLYHFCTKSPRE